MPNDQIQHESPQQQTQSPSSITEFLSLLRATFIVMPEVRLAYYQPGPLDKQLHVMEPDHARVVTVFTRTVSSEHVEKRLSKLRRQFSHLLPEEIEFLAIDSLTHREACEMAFNAQVLYGSMETVERDRLYRYNAFLQWNAGKKYSGVRQDQPPALTPSLTRAADVVSAEQFVTPLYRQLKLIEQYLREMKGLLKKDAGEFTADDSCRSLAESCMLKGIQSAILITMSVMHRKMRLSARDYRDLFLLMPVLGMTNRERASRLAKCADIRDRLVFQSEEVTAVEVHQNLYEVVDALRDFKAFILEWTFEHYYGPTGELIQTE